MLVINMLILKKMFQLQRENFFKKCFLYFTQVDMSKCKQVTDKKDRTVFSKRFSSRMMGKENLR